jgi:hypothetical protein
MHDQEKSDSAIVAVKSPNKTGYPVAEAMERRAGTKGNADQQSTHRTQIRVRVTQALGRGVLSNEHPYREPRSFATETRCPRHVRFTPDSD